MSANIQIDLFNQNLVQEIKGELLVSSITVAENVGYEHNAVIRLIRDNIKDFNEFGTLGFENQSFKDSLNRIQTREVALLNECIRKQQAPYL